MTNSGHNVLDIGNPWGAPVYRTASCVSTMIESRALEKAGAPFGTVIVSDFQSGAYGRVQSRPWASNPGENLLWTVLLRFSDFNSMPACPTLRAGLAVFEGVLQSFPALEGKAKIKWPNDIMLNGKKTCGILTESDGKNVYIGVGINVFQKDFGSFTNATSVMKELAGGRSCRKSGLGKPDLGKPDLGKPGLGKPDLDNIKFALLEKILFNLKSELEKPLESVIERVDQNLFLKDKDVTFLEGLADRGKAISGKLKGVSKAGGLLIIPSGEVLPREFLAGEIAGDL